jgi:hypothetical protein
MQFHNLIYNISGPDPFFYSHIQELFDVDSNSKPLHKNKLSI